MLPVLEVCDGRARQGSLRPGTASVAKSTPSSCGMAGAIRHDNSGLMIALEGKYAAYILRLDELVAMQDRKAAVKALSSEIPGALRCCPISFEQLDFRTGSIPSALTICWPLRGQASMR